MQKGFSLFFAAIAALLLASCASYESSSRLQYAETQLASFVNAQQGTYIEIDQQSVLSGKALEAEELRIFEAFLPVCIEPYTERITGAMNHAVQNSVKQVIPG